MGSEMCIRDRLESNLLCKANYIRHLETINDRFERENIWRGCGSLDDEKKKGELRRELQEKKRKKKNKRKEKKRGEEYTR